MSIAVDALQELPAEEESGLNAAGCCWYTTQTTCGLISSVAITTCHSCTNTNG
jgi:hypothetical protein